ncbi:unnamed protein product [Prorocentrum cordatum]|uniref:Integrase catalytic domain-containing protein n=1 Tax=Prorocentrum cordatum TaxID=2364126 RepID=A0ABN9U717_9DINO|nr:unnamed protein product [Polarella glacialis]
MVTLHQCMFGPTDDCGTLVWKTTRMLVPNGSCFSWWLDRACDRGHQRADAVGRGTLLSLANAWPDDLCKTLVSAGTRELARRADLKKLGVGENVANVPSQQTMRLVADEFKLRKDLIDVRMPRRSEAIPPPRGAARRIYATRTDKGVLADFSEVLDAEDKLGCVAGGKLGRPNAARTADLKLSTEFNEDVFLDETEKILSNKTRVMVILDGVSSFRVTIPTAAVRPIAGAGSLRCFLQWWLSWACPPKVLRRGAAKGHVARRFAEIGDKHNTMMGLVPAEAPQLKGRVDRAVDFFKDHFQRLNSDVQPTGSDDPFAWTSAAMITCNNRIWRNGFTLYQYALGRSPNAPAALIEATRATRGETREVGRLLGEHGWRDLAVAQAAEGHARLHLSYRGVPALATPEQARHASRGEAEMVENEDLARQLSQWRGGPALLKGFVCERGPGHDESSGQPARRRRKGDADSDGEGATGDMPAAKTPRAEESPPPPPPRGSRPLSSGRSSLRKRRHLNLERYLKRYHYLEMDTACKMSRLKIYLEMDAACQTLQLATHLRLTQLGRGARRTWARPLRHALRIRSLGKLDGQNLRRILALIDVYTSDLSPTAARQINSDSECVARLSSRVVSRAWKTAFEASALEERRKWIQCDAAGWPSEELAGAEKAGVPPMRQVHADKNEPTRGNLSREQHPLKTKSRNIALGYKDEQLLAGELQTNAPALTDTATAAMTQDDAIQPGWSLEQGDVDLAFLHWWRCLDSSRRVYFRAPTGGAPAVPELGRPFVPEGAILKAKEGICGRSEAPPLLWHEEHRDAIQSLPGASRSKLRPALFVFRDGGGERIGLIGARVDDDLVAGSPDFSANQAAKVGFHRCGRPLEQNDNGAIARNQNECTEGIESTRASAERRKTKGAKATAEERAMLHSGNGQIQWLARAARMDLAFGPAEGQARARDGDLEMQDLLDYNKLMGDAKTDHVNITFPAVESGDMLRQHLVELHHGLGDGTHVDNVEEIKMAEATDCKSLYDLLQKRRAVPSEKRLLIDIESLGNDIEFNSVESTWVNTMQMLADCPTKQDVRAGDYMRYVLRTGECRLTEDPLEEQMISRQPTEEKDRNGECDRSKYTRRRRPADQPFVREGYTYFEDCIADLRCNARVARPAPKHHLRWRMMLGQHEDDIYCEKLDDMVDWPGLDQDIERHEGVNVMLEEGVLAELGENADPDCTADLDDVTKIYIMGATSAETEEIGAGAAGAGATLVVCAVRRMVVDQCECQPRTRKKANHNIPVPDDNGEWVEVPGGPEQSGRPTSKKKATRLPLDKARTLHERLKHASYKKVEHDLGDVLEDDILEAYQLVVAGRSKCRRASHVTQEVPKGKGNEKGKGKSQSACGFDPDKCIHPADQLTTTGTNQYNEKVRCRLCDALLLDRDAVWWSEEKEFRVEAKAIRLERQKRELWSRSTAPTPGRFSKGQTSTATQSLRT